MSGRLRLPVSFVPWVEGVARQIGDPVDRLRFLRVAGPCVPPRSSAARRLRAVMFSSAIAAVFFLILAAAAVALSFVGGHAAPPTQPARTSISPALR